MDPKKLPIYELRDALEEALKTGNRIIIEAPTGSGKSTQVPQMVLDGGVAGLGEVVVLQPRLLAARLVAKRVAFERGVPLGGAVTASVRGGVVSVEAARSRAACVTCVPKRR